MPNKTDLLLRQILPDVTGGIGRPGKGTIPAGRCLDVRMNIRKDGYDSHGAYWGVGAPMRARFTPDLSFFEFYRFSLAGTAHLIGRTVPLHGDPVLYTVDKIVFEKYPVVYLADDSGEPVKRLPWRAFSAAAQIKFSH